MKALLALTKNVHTSALYNPRTYSKKVLATLGCTGLTSDATESKN